MCSLGIESIFCLDLNLQRFSEESSSAHMQLPASPHTFLKYFSTHDKAHLEILEISLLILAKSVYTNCIIQWSPQTLITDSYLEI